MYIRVFLATCMTVIFAGVGIAAAEENVDASAPSSPLCDGQVPTLMGTMGDDNLNGTPGVDVIHGRDGSDQIVGFAGDDIMCGGAGSDDIYAYEGNDRSFGGADNDSVEGGSGDDYIRLGGTGEVRPEWAIWLPNGNIACGDCGGPGPPGNDVIIGGKGIDGCVNEGPNKGGWWVSGGGGDDYIDLRAGDDCATGDGGDDLLVGRFGDDKMEAGNGVNELRGGRGDDKCFDYFLPVFC